MEQFIRSFATGSIEAPDPYDKYLDQINYYRKHTARDATCLFRVISEQMYNAQIYHSEMREICVNYMALKQSTYEDLIVTDLTFDEYLAKMSKPRTFGTLSELHALAYRFKRNVLLFEAYNAGSWYVSEPDFTENFIVFYTPLKHFDSVFEKPYIESLAFCQSIIYEVLYSHVFNLPDVKYAVERMLHDPEEGTHVSQIGVSPYDDTQETLTLSDGRYFYLDHPGDTECILENRLYCHFHNNEYDAFTSQLSHIYLQHEFEDDSDDFLKLDHLGCLPRRNISCVRQLLDENITPFSYKVAKALDDHIYRNIEFDVWKEARKNTRFKQWPQGDTLKVGVKCLVDNVHQNQKAPYCCYIQDINAQKRTCVVFIETFGEYRTVQFSSLRTMPSVNWMVPVRNRGEKKKKRNSPTGETFKYQSKTISSINEDKLNDLNYFTQPLHIPQQYCEYIATPNFTSSRYSKNDDTGSGNNATNNKNMQSKKQNTTEPKNVKTEVLNVKNTTAKRHGPANETKSGKTDSLNLEFEPNCHFGSHANLNFANIDAGVPSVPTTAGHVDRFDVDNASSNFNYGLFNHQVSQVTYIKRKELLQSRHPINLNSQPCTDIYGCDLPSNDVTTLRFFYNLGIEYLRFLFNRFPKPTVMSMLFDRRTTYFDPDLVDLSNDFNRCASFSGRDLYSNKPSENSNRRSFYASNTNKKNYSKNNNRIEFNKNKRQYGDYDAVSNHPQQNYNKTEYSDGSHTAGANSRTGEGENMPQYVTLSAPPSHFMTFHPGESGDSGNMYGVSVGYGMYPHNDNFITYPNNTYPMPVPGGMMLSESDESDLTQTYPYYNPQGYYYPPNMAPFQPVPMAPQGCWFPPQPPPPMPMQMPMSIPSSMAASTSTAPPMTATTYGPYNIAGTNDIDTITSTSVPFNPNEP